MTKINTIESQWLDTTEGFSYSPNVQYGCLTLSSVQIFKDAGSFHLKDLSSPSLSVGLPL